MKDVSRRNKIFLLFSFSLILPIPVTAQNISEKLCNEVFDSVHSTTEPTTIYRRNIYSKGCDFAFDAKGRTSVTISIEQYNDTKSSVEAFREGSMDFYGDQRQKTSFASLSSTRSWDDVALYLSKRKYDSYLLARKNRFVIKIFSDDRKILVNLEKLLRKVDFSRFIKTY